MQQVKAFIKAIRLSGWQVAADKPSIFLMYPSQSWYVGNSLPTLVKRINNAFRCANQIHGLTRKNQGNADYVDYFAPAVSDAAAGFSGLLIAYELVKSMIEAGAAGVHFRDQLVSAKVGCFMDDKVLVSTWESIQKLIATLTSGRCSNTLLLFWRGRTQRL